VRLLPFGIQRQRLLQGRKRLVVPAHGAPYGARNQQIIQEVTTDGLKSVMWNIDSLDWAPSDAPAPPQAKKSYYRESWALIVGINDYQHWPKLRYAVHDANAIADTLISKFSFKRENIRILLDGDATRERILATLGDELTDGRKVQRDDRVFVFFAVKEASLRRANQSQRTTPKPAVAIAPAARSFRLIGNQ